MITSNLLLVTTSVICLLLVQERLMMGFLSSVQTLVTRDINEYLISPYTRDDVWKALFHIGDTKAPGLDGLHAIFFKHFWHILG